MSSHRIRLGAAVAAMSLAVGALVVGGPASATPAGTHTDTWTTPGSYDWVVPAGVTTVTIEVAGAQGGANNDQTVSGGNGGYLAGEFTVTAGQTLKVHVGGQGGSDGTPGANGGGGAAVHNGCIFNGAGGGGASDVRTSGNALGDRIIVAGGGGGAGAYQLAPAPGVGGGSGPTGGASGSSGQSAATGGAPGTGSGGGAGGAGTGPTGSMGQQPVFSGLAGSLGVGGDGSDSGCFSGGGGGGGYYGGGGGGQQNPIWGSGGGGSAYIDPSATLTGDANGSSTGDGEVRITWSDPPAPTTTTTTTIAPTTTTTTVPAPAPKAAVCPKPVPPLRVFNNAFSLGVAKHVIDHCGSTGREVRVSGQSFWVVDPPATSSCPTWRAVRVVPTRNSVLIAKFLIDDCQFTVRRISGAIYVVPEGYPLG